MVRTEVQYFKRLTHHLLALEPDLIKINKIEYELQLANLIRIIEGGCDTDTGELVNLPTAVDVLNPFNTDIISLNKLYVFSLLEPFWGCFDPKKALKKSQRGPKILKYFFSSFLNS